MLLDWQLEHAGGLPVHEPVQPVLLAVDRPHQPALKGQRQLLTQSPEGAYLMRTFCLTRIVPVARLLVAHGT